MRITMDNFYTFIRVTFLLHLVMSFQVKAQPIIQWQKCLGGTKMDNGYSLKTTYDGGYISAGESLSNDGDVTMHHGSTDTLDIWIVKTDATGTIQWQKSFGGSKTDFSSCIIQTTDSGYVFVGTTYSSDGDLTLNMGNADIWVVKLDAAGNLQWQKSFGGTGIDLGRTIKQTFDGGFILGATTFSNDGDVSGNHGLSDLWLVKLDVAGNLQWQKCLGGTSYEGGLVNTSNTGFNFTDVSITQTADSGYFMASASCSNDGDLTFHHGSTAQGYTDYWMVKLNSSGVISWQQSLGGTQPDYISSASQTTDGGYILAGSTLSNDGDVSGRHGNAYDFWIVKVDATGTVQWKNTLGGTGGDRAYDIFETTDGGYFVSGQTGSPNNGDVAGRRGGGSDAWVLKLDVSGILQWQKCLGGSNYDYATAGFQTADGGYMVEGWTGSNNNDVAGNHSSGANVIATYNDLWMVKLSPVSSNVVKGNVFEDLNANCIKDSAEIGLKGRLIKAMPGNYFASTDVLGNYTLFVDSGAYLISHIPPSYYNQSCPAAAGTYNVSINSATPNSFGIDFADTLTSHCADLEVSIATSYLRACRKNTYVIQYKNTGATDAVNVAVSVNFSSQIIPLTSSIPWIGQYLLI
ncbi:MAG: hypothetical protein IPP71_07575 [Bacteroidetes bacterium]|nr:hypothetical protein [Bacteroidota bacterium]